MKELNFDHDKPIRRWTGRSGSQSNPAYMRKYYHENKHKGRQQASDAVRRAIKNGSLPSLKTNKVKCSECRYRATQYHHGDYNKPLDVVPVCHSCNQYLGESTEIKK